jgi:hypothetical protein
MFDETSFENFLSYFYNQVHPVHHLFEHHLQPIIHLHDDVQLLEQHIHHENRILYDLLLKDREQHSKIREENKIFEKEKK